MTDAQFRKSSHSGGPNGSCVEVANLDGMFAVRDSKDSNGAVLSAFSVTDWRAFVASLKTA